MTIGDFLKQPSTIRGLIFLVGLTGWKIAPQHAADLAYMLGNLLAIHEVARNEGKRNK